MLSSPPSSDPPVRRAYAWAESGLVVALLATFLWTTLCLGGFMAQTMAVSGPLLLGLGAWGGLLWAFGPGGGTRTINRAAFLPLPFLAYALASTLGWAPAGWLAWTEWLLWFQMWLVFVLLLHFGRSAAHTRLIWGAFSVLILAGAGMAVYQRFSDPHWIMLGRTQAAQFWGRSSGMFGIPNSLAGLVELLIPVCAALLFSRAIRPSGKVICGWLAGLGLLAMTLTGSRGGWLSLALALMIWPALAARSGRKKLLGVLAALLLISGGFGALYRWNETARQRIEPFLDGRFELSRPKVWSGGVEIWADHPWLGTGAGAFGVAFDAHRPAGYRDNPVWAHNDYLNTLADYGIVGFSLWTGAGVALLGLGLIEIKRCQRAGPSAVGVFGSAKTKLGLWLGLLAFALHLGVDFHTKIPALAYAAASLMAVLLRDAPGLQMAVSRRVAWWSGAALTVVAVGLTANVAVPLYRAEGLRAEARQTIDRYARKPEGDLKTLARVARSSLLRAVRIDPQNAQAWADLAYATSLAVEPSERVAAGRAAELAADRALSLCPIKAEYWVRKGIALDLQLGRPEAEDCYRKATELAPRSALWWYHYAFHLHAFTARSNEAQQALATCLALDPHYPPAERLRRRISTTRQLKPDEDS